MHRRTDAIGRQAGGFPRRDFLKRGAVLGGGVAAVGLVGCGDDDDETPPNGATPDDSSDDSAQPTPANGSNGSDVQAGGTWRRGAGGNIALTGLPYTWAGTLATGGNGALRPQGLIWGTLVRPAETGTDFEPDHAEEWEWSSERDAITFKLRDDIYYHSGRQFTAQDVAFNLDEIQKEEWATGHAARLNPVADYEVIDDFTIRFDLIRPNALAMEFANTLLLADMDTVAQIQEGVLVGTGAFQLENYSPIEGASLVKYERYHLGEPLLDRIEYTIFDDPAALAIALETGVIHDSGLPPEEAERHYESGQFNVVELPPTGSVTPIGIRTDLPPVDDKRVRQAIGVILDRQRYQEDQFVGRFDKLGRLYWPEFSPAYDAELDEPIYDLDRARDLLREAGYANGVPEPILINTLPIRPWSPAVAQLLQQDGAEVGFNFVFEPLEYSDKLERYYNASLDHMWMGFGDSGSVLSPAASLLFSTLTDGKVCRYEDPEYLQAWDDIVNGGDDYQRFNELFIDGAFNHVLARAVPINFEREDVHYTRNFIGEPVWHKMWVSG